MRSKKLVYVIVGFAILFMVGNIRAQNALEETARTFVGETYGAPADELTVDYQLETEIPGMGAVTQFKMSHPGSGEIFGAFVDKTGQAWTPEDFRAAADAAYRALYGQLEIQLQPLRLSKMAEEIADEMLRHTDSHHFAINFPPDFPIVDADPRRIRQVLRNIIDNAIKYAPNGGLIVIRGEVRPDDVVVSIADQGVGISPEDMIPLFDKYFRVKAPTGYHVPGTGLGLPVSRAIIEAHGGRRDDEPADGHGRELSFAVDLGVEAE